MMLRRLLILVTLLVGNAHAHVQLSDPILNAAIDDVQRLRQTASNNGDSEARASAIFEIASISTEIVGLMNADVAAHNAAQSDLLDESVKRLNSIGIGITWSGQHQRYFYDCAEYQEYLRLLPDGVRAADSLFQLIERGYYLDDNIDATALERRAAEKLGFLNRFPGFGETARIRIFLSIDYRDLSRLCRQRQDQKCEQRLSILATEQLQNVINNFPQSSHAAVAVGLLKRFEQEFSNSLQTY